MSDSKWEHDIGESWDRVIMLLSEVSEIGHYKHICGAHPMLQ